MDPIVNVPNITVDNSTIPYVKVNGTGIKFIGTQRIGNNSIQPIGTRRIADSRIWLNDVPQAIPCLLYTSPSPRDVEESRMPSSA